MVLSICLGMVLLTSEKKALYSIVHTLYQLQVGTTDKKDGTTCTRIDPLKGGTAQLEECTGSGSTDGRHGVPAE
jgi:hypothetical protein